MENKNGKLTTNGENAERKGENEKITARQHTK